jgi:hypothetical protein
MPGAIVLERTNCRRAVYDHKTLLVATLSPACRMSIASTALKKSFISSELQFQANQLGPPSERHRMTKVGSWTSDRA